MNQDSLRNRVALALARRSDNLPKQVKAVIPKLAPGSVRVQKRLAEGIERNVDAQAAAEFLESMKPDGDTGEALFLRGFYRERSGDIEGAVRLYSAAIDAGWDHPEVRYRRAHALAALSEGEDARADLEYALGSDGSDMRSLDLRLSLAQNEPVWRKREILELGLPAKLKSLEWRRELAAVSFEMRDWAVAAREYEWCAANGGGQNDRLLAGLAYYRSDNSLSAWRIWDDVVAKSKDKEVRFLGIGRLLQRSGYWSDASSAYERTIRDQGATAELEYALGFALERQLRWAEASIHLERAAVLDSSNETTWYQLGLALEKQGKYAEAARAYRHSQPGDAARTTFKSYRLATCLAKAGQEAEAFEFLFGVEEDDDVALEPEEFQVQLLGQLYKEAIATGATPLLRQVANIARENGLYEIEVRALEELTLRQPDQEWKIYWDLSRAYAREGRISEAVAAYIESRPLWQPYGVQLDPYVKKKHDRDLVTYLAYREELPVQEHVVLYESNQGQILTCSVRPLLKAMVKERPEWVHVVVSDSRESVRNLLGDLTNVVVVPRNSNAFLKYLATAKYLVSNNTFPPYFSRRPDQRYLNVWHGTPIKTLGKQIKSGEMDHRNATRNFLHATHLALPNEYTANILMREYDVERIYRGRLAAVGSPRMDETLSLSDERRTEIRDAWNVGPQDRVVLFAPTWRGTLANKTVDLDWLKDDLAAMKASGHRVVFRGHPLMEQALANVDDLGDGIQIVGREIDTNELLGAVDVVVSDYSSIAIDSVGAGIYTILYTPDREQYEFDRGLAIRLEELPVVIATTRAELGEALGASLRVPEDLGVYAGFWEKEDGHATERVISFFFEDEPVEGELETYVQNHDEPSVVAFQGHFIPNGITASAIALDTFLVDEGVNLTLVAQGGSIMPYQDRVQMFERIPPEVAVLPHVGQKLFTPEETWINGQYMKTGEFPSETAAELLHSAYAREYRRLFGDAQFDTAVCFEGYVRYWALVFASAPSSTTKVIYAHTNMEEETSKRFPWLKGVTSLYPSYDRVVSVSDSVHEANVGQFSDRATTTEFAISPNLYSPEDVRAKGREDITDQDQQFLEAHPGHKYVCVGRLSVEKGQDRLLDAFAKVRHEGDALVLIGDGPMMAPLKARAATMDLEDHVYFAGHRDNPFSLESRCDSFVMSSRHEGQGIVLLEALSLGLLVGSTDIPGPRSILKRGVGELVESSVRGIEQLLVRLQDDGADKTEFSETEYLSFSQASALRGLGVQG